MFQELKISIVRNVYFFIPFVIWAIVGACMLLCYSRSELFFAVNDLHSPFLDRLNTVFSAYGRGDVIPIVLLSLLLIPAYRNRNYIVTTLLFGIIIPLVIYLSKNYFKAPRPLKYYGVQNVHTVPWLDNLFETSFPSGHTLGAFGFFAILCLYLPKPLKPLSVIFLALALACAYSRLYLGQHFFADVYAGSMIGTLLSLLIYSAGMHFFPETKSVRQ